MVGRRVRCIYPAREGVVIKWDIFAGMCDALVKHDDGYLCWYGSSSLRPVDGLGDLPSRLEAQMQAELKSKQILESIMEKFIAEEMQPTSPRWPGAEFGKYIVGKSIERAIDDVERRIKEREST